MLLEKIIWRQFFFLACVSLTRSPRVQGNGPCAYTQRACIIIKRQGKHRRTHTHTHTRQLTHKASSRNSHAQRSQASRNDASMVEGLEATTIRKSNAAARQDCEIAHSPRSNPTASSPWQGRSECASPHAWEQVRLGKRERQQPIDARNPPQQVDHRKWRRMWWAVAARMVARQFHFCKHPQAKRATTNTGRSTGRLRQAHCWRSPRGC